MKRIAAILLATTILASCEDKKKTDYSVPAAVGGWTARYGNVSNCTNFAFGEPHYCINGSIPAQLGQTIRMKYTVSPGANLVATEGTAPAAIHLFLWRRGDNLSCTGGPTGFQGYRYWSRMGAPLTPGTHELIVPIDVANWSDCYAQSDAGAFAATVGNLLAVGYSFGGQFYGHGVKGNGNFTLDSYTIQ